MARQLDPKLTSLFASSLGPTHALGSTKSHRHDLPQKSLSPSHGNGQSVVDTPSASSRPAQNVPSQEIDVKQQKTHKKGNRKRKREDEGEGLEDRYWQRLTAEDAKEKITGSSRLKANDRSTSPGTERISKHVEKLDGAEVDTSEEDAGSEPPQHETVTGNTSTDDTEKLSRTVFLSNVSTSAIKSRKARKVLLDHLAAFSMPSGDEKPRIESIRFRSTAFSTVGIPRKASFAKRDLMDSTTTATNAYAVYTTKYATLESCKKLNGTVVLERHLRVDSVVDPGRQDNRRCVFVGNLGFVDDETALDVKENGKASSKKSKVKQPADIEEGLWREFGKVGKVENVRVVRDKVTRVGKGIAYVQFTDGNAVERALVLDGKKFPPLLPRTMRVTRARKMKGAPLRIDRDRQKRSKPAGRGNLSRTPPVRNKDKKNLRFKG